MKKLKYLLALSLSALLLQSCENDIERINFLGDSTIYPDVIGEDIEVIYSDSAKTKLFMQAKELLQFNHEEKPYSEFPKGVHIIFYDDSLRQQSDLRANYAIYYNKEKLWHAKGNVIAKNLKKDEKLETEELFWDEEKEEIYSESYTKIVNENGVFYGEKGFESDQSLENYTLYSSKKSVINIKEDE